MSALKITMGEQESAAWRPEIVGWSDDILPVYRAIAEQLPHGAIFVELGVAHGRSAVFMLEELERLGRGDVAVHLVDASPEPASLVERGLTRGGFTYWRCSTSLAARFFAEEAVECVFVDADHSREGCLEDLRAWEPKVRPGGLLAGHDYGEPMWPGVREAVDGFFRGREIMRPTRSVWALRKAG